jgi:hypothetical protein
VKKLLLFIIALACAPAYVEAQISGFTVGRQCRVIEGSAAPEGVVRGKPCDMYVSRTAGEYLTWWIKEVGTGTAGWKPLRPISLYWPNTTSTQPGGVLHKNNARWMHDFSFGNNGTVTPEGQNVFIGENAGNFTIGSTATSTGQASYNVGIGQEALSSLTTGARNVAYGTYAGRGITTGTDNVFIGHRSGQRATGTGNAGFGYYTLGMQDADFTGSFNVAGGYFTGWRLTSGSYNLLLGLNALGFMETGNSNIGLGVRSGQATSDGTPNTSGSENIFIGTDTKPAGINQTNQIVIGLNAIGSGSNTATWGGPDILLSVFRGAERSGTLAAEPTCDITRQSERVYVKGGPGVADTWRVCTKNADDSYSWKSII